MKSSTSALLAFAALVTFTGSFVLAGYVYDATATPITGAAVMQVTTPTGHGSGVSIGNVIITAAHVVADKPAIRAGGETAEVLWSSSEYDIAAIRTERPFPAARLRCTEPKVGEHITAYGYPAFMGKTETLGRVSGKTIKNGPWRTVFVANLTIYMGNSGGPAFDKNGQIVAFVVGWLEGTSFALMVPSIEVCRLLGR